MGFTGLVLSALFHRDGLASEGTSSEWRPPDGKPHFPPKAKRVIWIFFQGGMSHLETFDPKPALNRYAGKSIAETPYQGVLDSPFIKKNVEKVMSEERKLMTRIYPMQTGYGKRGQSGIEISDWLPKFGQCVDQYALVRSVWTTDNDHSAQLQFHTGRHVFQGYFPSIGSWVHYGLGSLNENLPQFAVLGPSTPSALGGQAVTSGNYLGPEHSGVYLARDPARPLPFASPEENIYRQEQEREFELLRGLNSLSGDAYPDDPSIRARIKAYELAFRMQMAVPEIFKFTEEKPETQALYGLNQDHTQAFGQNLLAARRLVEHGVRFVQVFHGYGGDTSGWDSHEELKKNHTKLCAQIDGPMTGLLQDLRQRGLLEETLVVWGSEFGRTPGVELSAATAAFANGRDHHPFGFTVGMAGGGIKSGVAHGATDELGFHAVENRHYITDIHATVLHQLGLDPRKLEVPGQKRLEIDFGHPIREIIA
jgi:hypothetical protein